jgi:tetratricopeptide (TPR) repeat protein
MSTSPMGANKPIEDIEATLTSTTPRWISTSRWGPIRRPSAYNNRGNVWYRRGDFDRAIADDEAIQLEPNYGHAYINRGGGWGDKGDFDRAIKDFVQAIRLDPKDA